MTAPRVRGAAYISSRAHIVEVHGEAAFSRVLSALDPDVRALFEEPADLRSWRPFLPWATFLETADGLLGKGDMALVRDGGRWAALQDIPVFFPDFVKAAVPRDLVRLTGQFYSSYYDVGRTEGIALEGADTATYEIVAFPTPHAAQCNRILGWIRGAFELISVGVVVSMPLCRARGDDRCLFLAKGHALRDQ